MKTMIIYDSPTGNTKYLADGLQKILPDAICQPIQKELDFSDVHRVFLGFWTDKGSCSDAVQKILPALSGKKVFLFGTAGFGTDQSYFAQIIARVQAQLPSSTQVLGWYMCAGKMPARIQEKYRAMLDNPETAARGEMLLKNFDLVASHPNENDLDALYRVVQKIL